MRKRSTNMGLSNNHLGLIFVKNKDPLKLKICLIGESAVGKTSLIKRYVYDEFEDKYIVTIGTKVTKKSIEIPNPGNGSSMEVQLLIWDIVGQQNFRQLLKESYFYGTQGVIGTCDVTREDTLSEMHNWMEMIQRIAKKVPVVFVGNKCDLSAQQVNLNDIKNFATGYDNSYSLMTSAKTGLNVDNVFDTISKKIVEDLFESGPVEYD
ncbi:MAG: GTP-binding protein [Thermoplasmata archaeon]|nr:MAG: GTP-binding protein [Thermoplasmata archaeon]